MLSRTNLQPPLARSYPYRPQFPVGEQPYMTNNSGGLPRDTFTQAVPNQLTPDGASFSSENSFPSASFAMRCARRSSSRKCSSCGADFVLQKAAVCPAQGNVNATKRSEPSSALGTPRFIGPRLSCHRMSAMGGKRTFASRCYGCTIPTKIKTSMTAANSTPAEAIPTPSQ
jgi:hypothetical protein